MIKTNVVKKIFIFGLPGKDVDEIIVVSDTEEHARLNLPEELREAKLLKVRDFV